MYDTILDALRRGAVADALGAAREAVAAQPEDARAHRLLAVALRQGGDPAAALASLDQAIALTPDDADLHLERAGLLLGARQLDAAQAALARSTGLDPNQFPAYILQAQLALGRGDLDEADRQARLAARIAPQHPQVAAVEGMVALRRNDGERALTILAGASERHPDEPQLRYALGFAYMAQGHLAFAEQAFRGVVERVPDVQPLRGLIAELLRRQGRPQEAVAELAPLLTDPATASPGLRRYAGELELAAGHPQEALAQLGPVLAEFPRERRALLAALEAWRQLGDVDEARRAVDALLAANPEVDDLWLARLSLEAVGSDEARAVGEGWLQARPDHVSALEAMLAIHDFAGDSAAVEALAERIVAREPMRLPTQLRLVDALLQRDPPAAVARMQALLDQADSDELRRALQQTLGSVQDRAGQAAAAVATWTALNAELAPLRLPRPEPSAPRSSWPELAPLPEPTPMVALLWGAPGSGVEQLAALFDYAGGPFRADRFGGRPPQDGLQRDQTPARLLSGELPADELVAVWRAALPARGIPDGQLIDWLLWWDNALLLALRPHLPEALLLVALRDPRDMLLDWLAVGAPAPLAIESVTAAAAWLANTLNQIAALHEQDLFPHRLLRLDDALGDPQALATLLGTALEIPMPAPPRAMLGPARMPAGRWRAYAEALAEAFALLTPVARRLGYAAT